MAPCRGGHTRRKKLRYTHFNEAAFLDRTKSALACEKATDFVGDHSITGPESDFTPALPLLLVVLVCIAQLGPIIANGRSPDLASLPERDAVIKELEGTPGDDLLFVRVGPGHVSLLEWVFNGAEIDEQQVVVARYFGVEENQRLINYYPNRKAWVVDVDSSQHLVKVRPYADGTANAKGVQLSK